MRLKPELVYMLFFFINKFYYSHQNNFKKLEVCGCLFVFGERVLKKEKKKEPLFVYLHIKSIFIF